MLEPLAQGAGELIKTDAFWGTAIVALALVVVYLWREIKLARNQGDANSKAEREAADEALAAERTRHAQEMANERAKHATEMAEQRRLNEQLQAARLDEVKLAFTEVTKAVKTIELVYAHGGAK